MTDTIFADGLIVKRNEKAPDYVLCNLSVKVSEFIEFLNAHQSEGWVNVECKVSKNGKPYAALDTWRPTQGQSAKQGMEQARAAAEPSGGFPDEDIPFAQHERDSFA